MPKRKKKFIFVTGGVLSSLGKGICSSSLGMLMEQRGIKVTMAKMDPYLNVDPGTMSPIEHGEVFVLDDGSETDLDLGHYSRFVSNAVFTHKNSFTTGRVYEAVIRRERSGGYLGQTVQVIPHITDEIKNRIREIAEPADLAIIEVGGTVGDIESLPFLEAIRQLKHEEGGENVLFVHLTLVPYMAAAGELKTKPTQHSVKELREIGIQPDILLCRSDRIIPKELKAKIGLFCNLRGDQVFTAPDVETIYQVPLSLSEEGVDDKVAELLGMWTARPSLSKWIQMVNRILQPGGEVNIGIVGKYTDWTDSYKSLGEALVHAGVFHNVKVNTRYLDSEAIEKGDLKDLQSVDGVLVPGGFGERGISGKIMAAEFAREKKVPYFGICLGMQLAVIEFARHVLKMTKANSEEFCKDKPVHANDPLVIGLMESQKKVTDMGGTMRLGAYACEVSKGTKAFTAYGKNKISERHRHRYEVSNIYRPQLEKAGMIISGKHIDESRGLDLVEMIEVPDHPWFLGCQFHPEFLSKPLAPHPLFRDFIGAAVKYHGEHR